MAAAALALVASSCSADDLTPNTTADPTESTEREETTERPTGTIDDPTEEGIADRSVYGVDLSELDLPAADPYEDYETYEDDTGQVEIAVPTDWDDVDTSEGERDGVEVPGIWASVDLEELQSGYTVPGAQVDLRTASAAHKLVDLLNSDNATDEVCVGPETFDYDDGLYTGTAELWTDCSDDGAALLELVALRDGNQYVTLEIQMLTDADIDAAIAALEGFVAAEIDPGEQWSPGDDVSTQQVGNTFTLAVHNNPSTGDDWGVVPTHDTAVVAFRYEDYESDNPGELDAGVAGTSFFTFQAVGPGSTTIHLENCSDCEPGSIGGGVSEVADIDIVVEP